MATKLKDSNGVATLPKKATTKTATPSANGELKTKKTEKEQSTAKATPVKVVTPPKPKFSLEERINRVKLLDGLTNKRQKVVQTLTDLRKFQFSSDDSCDLELNDSSGKEFRTSNSNLIGMLTSHLESLLQGKVKELDEQIIDFEL